MTESPEVDISFVFKKFHDHFTIPGNEKIIFSGSYGIGKSFFLNSYFKKEDVKAKYNKIELSPVNYVVSSNEDIFELIKVDIIRNLFEQDHLEIQTISKKLPVYKVLKEYAKTNPLQLVKNLSATLAKVIPYGEVVSSVSSGVYDLIDSLDNFEKQLNSKEKTKAEKLDDYGSSFIDKKGTFYEYNYISQLINESLKELKKTSGKENVLVIEDFDRLDPEHVFRILNIFSAHHFQDGNGNKFGFDKIIVVCHLDNIKNIFSHFYGKDTDFEGYIDKFYSIIPFHFDNSQAVASFLREKHKVDLPDYAVKCLAEVLVFIYQMENKSLRQLFKTKLIPKTEEKEILNFDLRDSINKPNYSDSSRFYITTNDVPLIYILRVLKNFYGSYPELHNKLLAYSNLNASFEKNEEILEAIIKTILLPIKIQNHTERRLVFFSNSYTFETPVYEYRSFQFQVLYKWFPVNPYKGDCSFFKEVDYNLIGIKNGNSLIQQQSYNLEVTTNIFQSFMSFLDYAQKNKLLTD